MALPHSCALTIALALMAGSAPVFAQATSVGSVRIDNRLLQRGDSTARIMQTLGEPDAVVQLESPAGGATGQRWEYWDLGEDVPRALSIVVRGGRIAEIRQEILR